MTVVAVLSIIGFVGGAALLVYAYWGYRFLLRCLRGKMQRPTGGEDANMAPRITVLLTVHNEERNIKERLQNLVAQDYPSDRVEIVVCSDGSADGTESLVEEFVSAHEIRVVRTSRVGKSQAQNAAMPQTRGDIVVLTDAETRFDKGFLKAVAACFADREVGCVTAHVRFIERSGAIAQNQGRYWAYELSLRELESDAGILAVASGQAMAFRRELFRPLPVFAGDDCIIPLDVVSQGKRVVHCREALAYDSMENEGGKEFRTRVRMTMRNWTGTWRYPALLNPFKHAGYAFALWSHKLLRWLGWVGLLLMAAGTIGLIATRTMPVASFGFLLVVAAACIGWWAEERRIKLPVANTIYSFFLANTAFMVGVLRALAGRRIVIYRSGSLKAH
ncbi:MAG TPA: glycosyltransferase [Pseudolabrys sp.]|nr:glycosyltransferase [Pseudolabrys sp.]